MECKQSQYLFIYSLTQQPDEPYFYKSEISSKETVKPFFHIVYIVHILAIYLHTFLDIMRGIYVIWHMLISR